MADEPQKPYYVTCPVCGSPDVAADASAKWDFEAQEWSISGIYDDKTCQTCSYDGHSFEATTEDELTDTQRAFIFDGEDYPVPATIKVCG